MSVYDNPQYYEIAFGYQDVRRQVNFFEDVALKLTGKRAKRFLDIGCGPSIQLREIARRGYEGVGLDNSPMMLQYLHQKASEEGLAIETLQADMRDFSLSRKCDFAFVLSGSLFVNSNEEFLKHLRCVANSLNQKGVYLLENVALDPSSHGKEEWTMRRGDVEVKTTFEAIPLNPIEQISEERLILEVNDRGIKRTLTSHLASKDFCPQEMKSLVDLSGLFRFVGFFKHLSWAPLKENERENIVLMQKLEP